jgi:hypothetical protein
LDLPKDRRPEEDVLWQGLPRRELLADAGAIGWGWHLLGLRLQVGAAVRVRGGLGWAGTASQRERTSTVLSHTHGLHTHARAHTRARTRRSTRPPWRRLTCLPPFIAPPCARCHTHAPTRTRTHTQVDEATVASADVSAAVAPSASPRLEHILAAALRSDDHSSSGANGNVSGSTEARCHGMGGETKVGGPGDALCCGLALRCAGAVCTELGSPVASHPS